LFCILFPFPFQVYVIFCLHFRRLILHFIKFRWEMNWISTEGNSAECVFLPNNLDVQWVMLLDYQAIWLENIKHLNIFASVYQNPRCHVYVIVIQDSHKLATSRNTVLRVYALCNLFSFLGYWINNALLKWTEIFFTHGPYICFRCEMNDLCHTSFLWHPLE
jgi:hypothetical protein